MKKRLSLLMLFLVLLTGCWNSRESDKIDYVFAVGIDLSEADEIILTIQTPVLEALKPNAPGGEKKYKTISVKGKTTFEGIRNYIDVTGQKLFWGHTQTYVIGEEAARKGVGRFLDFFSADPELRGTSYVAVCKGKAKDLLEANPQFTPIPATYMNNLVKNAVLNGKSPTVMFADFNRMLAEPTGSQPYLPLMELMTREEYDKKHASILGKYMDYSKQTPVYYTVGTAVFHGTKLVGYLNEKETRGLNWTKNTLKSALVTVDCGEYGIASLELIGGVKERQKVKVEGDKAMVEVKVKANLNIADRSGFLDVSEEAVIRKLEKGFADVVTAEIEAAFNKAIRKYHSDIMAFGNTVSDANPKLWEQIKSRWENEILPRAELSITVEGRIRRTSRTLYSPWVKSPSD
ncbi:MAG: hypothetical protein K0R57_889 [Paenibacillaceae bacterium]|jgi:spore germination protein KC|nr:hypothetical protein [Paenibacillaceae bacterium]